MLGFATTTVKIILGIAPMLQEGKELSQNPIILKTDIGNNRDTRFSFLDENKKTESGFPIAVHSKYAKTCFWLFSLPRKMFVGTQIGRAHV